MVRRLLLYRLLFLLAATAAVVLAVAPAGPCLEEHEDHASHDCSACLLSAHAATAVDPFVLDELPQGIRRTILGPTQPLDGLAIWLARPRAPPA